MNATHTNSYTTEHADILLVSHVHRQSSTYVSKRVMVSYTYHDIDIIVTRMQWGDKNNYRFHATIDYMGQEYFTRCTTKREVQEFVFSVISSIR